MEFEDIKTTTVRVADDVASAGPAERHKRRGVAGLVYCFKIAGAKAATMASLDERLSSQAQSIEGLKTTVSQTDGLLERVLESLDTLQGYGEPAEVGSEGS